MGVSTESELGLDKDRNSDPTLETRIKDGDLKQIKELNEEKRKSARRKEFIMAELLETERSYVKVLSHLPITFKNAKYWQIINILKLTYIEYLLTI